MAGLHFHFLKDPLFVDALYVKKPERVEALGYVLLMACLPALQLGRAARTRRRGDHPLAVSSGIKAPHGSRNRAPSGKSPGRARSCGHSIRGAPRHPPCHLGGNPRGPPHAHHGVHRTALARSPAMMKYLSLSNFRCGTGVRKTSDTLFRLFPVPGETRSPHRLRLLGGGFRPMESRGVSPTPHSGARQESDGMKLPSVSGRWCPEPPCYGALCQSPRRFFRHVVATGEMRCE